jgi:tetratricopeptide (TPR) repeat protein
VLAKRPGDLRSMANRALAADLLGRLAIRRHDYAVATDYAAKSAEAGENYVRFNPSDLNSWVYWVRGAEQQATVLLEQGQVDAAIEAFRRVVALDRDPRKPASLGPMLWNMWGQLMITEGRAGQFEAARQSHLAAAAAAVEAAALEDPASGRKALFELYGDALQARLDLDQGNDQAAFDQATQVATRLRALGVSGNATGSNLPSNAEAVRANFLRNTLATVTLAALRTGRYGEAESAARERAALPPNPFSELDPQDEKSRAQMTLAHALVLQGRTDEARAITDVELPRYQGELKGGAGGLAFAKDHAYALYVDALTRSAGDPRRASNLAEALRRLDAMGAEVNRLVDIRELRDQIGSARAG